MLVLNQEFRFPMRLPFIGTSLGGAIFYDGGNVYSRLSRISLHSMLPAPTFALQNPALPAGPTNVPVCATNCTTELNSFAHTIGLGVRYKTPVGPIRIDFGSQLNRPLFVIPIPCPSGAANCQVGSLGQPRALLPEGAYLAIRGAARARDRNNKQRTIELGSKIDADRPYRRLVPHAQTNGVSKGVEFGRAIGGAHRHVGRSCRQRRIL